MNKIVLNGLNQRPGGGVVVLEALASGIRQAAPKVAIEIVVMHDDTLSLLAPLRQRDVSVIKVTGYHRILDRFLSAHLLRKTLHRSTECVLVSLNHRVPDRRMTQVVYHVNLARFERDEPFSFGTAILQRLRDMSSKAALTRASANAFESEYVYAAAKRRYGHTKIQSPSVVYIGIDERHLVDAASLDCRRIDPRIIVITSPNPHKRNELLVPLLVELRRLAPEVPWCIHVYGGRDAVVWEPLRQAAAEAGVDDGLVFEGYRSRSDIAEGLDRGICLYSPSSLESFCMVALEAMARGCPAVVSTDSAMPESVADAGIVVDANDTHMVAAAIRDLWDDESKRLAIGLAGLKRARELRWRDSGRAFAKLCNAVACA